MEMKSVKLVYFSPTGTTRTVARGIAAGLAADAVEEIDITRPGARQTPLRASQEELLVVAVPVYMGRVPALLRDWLDALEADVTPAVCVVVYGNRAYDDALLELKNTLTGRGCIPVACGAFVGEHSFSTPGLPVAQGRPDGDDLAKARAFGRKIREKLGAAASIAQISDVAVPGTHPYGGVTKLWDVDFIAVNEQCAHCGLCAEICPVGAIDAQRSDVVDKEKCITCCACLKSCPRQARSVRPSPVTEAAKRLNGACGEPKAPECFL